MLLAFMSTLGFCALYVDMTAVIGTSANILAVIMSGLLHARRIQRS